MMMTFHPDAMAAFEALRAFDSVIPTARLNAPDAFLHHCVAPYLGAHIARWFDRSPDTDGKESRVLMVGRIGVVPVVWTATCLNAPGTRLRKDHIEREAEWLNQTQATQGLVFTTASVPLAVREHTVRLNAASSGSLLLLGKREMNRLKEHPRAIGHLLLDAADKAMEAKALQIESHWKREPIGYQPTTWQV